MSTKLCLATLTAVSALATATCATERYVHVRIGGASRTAAAVDLPLPAVQRAIVASVGDAFLPGPIHLVAGGPSADDLRHLIAAIDAGTTEEFVRSVGGAVVVAESDDDQVTIRITDAADEPRLELALSRAVAAALLGDDDGLDLETALVEVGGDYTGELVTITTPSLSVQAWIDTTSKARARS